MANLAQAMSDGVFRVVGDLESPCIVFGVICSVKCHFIVHILPVFE